MAQEELKRAPKQTQAGDEWAVQDGVLPLSLDEIKACDILEMAKDKFKTRQLQRSLTRGGEDHANLIFEKVEPHIAELVTDQHGNYLMQKIIELANIEQFDIVFNILKDDLIPLAKDAHGTRAVQKIVEQAMVRDRVQQVAQALPQVQAEELARHITGFHVIVKLLDSLPAERVSELLEHLCGDSEKVVALGKDQWGCCVLKKCIDRAATIDSVLKNKIIDSIAKCALDLVQDAFGNYVVQHLIINRSAVPNPNISRLIDAFKGHVLELSLQKYSSNVLEKCLSNTTDKDRNKIINEILNPPNNVKPSEAVRMLLFHQFGNYVFQQSLEVGKDPQFSLLIEHSKKHIQEIYMKANEQQGVGAGQASAESQPTTTGSLSAAHMQRLAVKLVKKYPVLAEGMDIGSVMVGMDTTWMFDQDPMGYGFGGYMPMGFDAYGYPIDPFMQYGGGYGNMGFAAPVDGKAAKNRGNQGRRGQKNDTSQKGKGGGQGAAGKGTAPAGSGETVRVGRIVGFWPNYEITYDEVPVQGQPGGGNRGARPKKAKGKAAPKPKAPA